MQRLSHTYEMRKVGGKGPVQRPKARKGGGTDAAAPTPESRPGTGLVPNVWIEDRLTEIGGKKIDLAKAMGIAPSRVSDILNGTRAVAAFEARRMADYLRLPVAIVITNLLRATGALFSPESDISLPVRSVRVVGEVQGGIFKPALEWPPDEQYDLEAPVKGYQGIRLFGLRVVGESVNKEFPHGSTAICALLMDLGDNYQPEEGAFYAVFRTRDGEPDMEATIKQYRRGPDGHHYLWPNSTHPDFQQPWKINGDEDQQVQLWARVVGKYQEY